jgi:hypothetical protein
VDGRAVAFDANSVGDIQRAQVIVPQPGETTQVVFVVEGGTEVYAAPVTPGPGAVNEGLRVLRARPEAGVLRLVLEGRAGRTYELGVRTGKTLGAVRGVTIAGSVPGGARVAVAFDGTGDAYVRREIAVPLN